MGTHAISDGLYRNQIAPKKACKAAILVSLLFLAPLLAVIPSDTMKEAPMMTGGKSTEPDVAVTDLNVTTPSVIGPSGNPTLAPLNHIIRVSLMNQGGSTAYGNITLQIDGAVVDNRTVDLNPGQQEVHLLYWDASSVVGTGIEMTAVWVKDSSSSDSDTTNDQLSLSNIEVSSYEHASDLADSLPSEGSSLARAMWAGAITVVNTGNQPVDITADLTLTPEGGGASVALSSTTETLQPGSLANPPIAQNISISFDGTNLEGNYTLGGHLEVSGAGSMTVDIESRTVNFIALRASLIPANSRSADPGSQTILNFILQNSGTASDDFTVTQSNDSIDPDWWADSPSQIHCSACPLGLLTVDAGQTEAIQVPVNVPADAANGAIVTVTIEIQSEAAGYVLEAITIVMAGGTYSAEIYQNHSYVQPGSPPVHLADFANLTPGISRTLDYTLKNTGTAPAQFQIDVGPLESVPYWTIYSPTTITDVVMPNETRTIPVTITTPHVQMPLNPSWKISSIEQVDIAIQAIPLEGGIPAVNQTTLVIDGIVELDVKVTGGSAVISAEDVESGNTNRFVDFEVSIIHNLGSNSTLAQVNLAPKSTGSDATGKSFTALNGGSAAEKTRWMATATPSTMELEPGEVGYGKVAIGFTPNAEFPYPSAGTFTFAFSAVSDWGSFPNTLSKNSSTTVSIDIEEYFSAELTSSSVIATGDPSSQITFDMQLVNNGNSASNFTLGVIGIEDWDVSLSTNAVNALSSRTNLYPQTSTMNPDGNKFTVTVRATPPATASADQIHEVWVYANSTETDELLAYSSALFQLTELISAEMVPANSTAVIDSWGATRVGQTTIMLQLNNTGNSNVTYDLQIWNLDGSVQVSFADDGTEQLQKSQTVAPGAQAIVRVYATVGLTARADIDSKFEISVSNNGTELDRSGVVVQVAPDHAVNILSPSLLTAAPGTTLTVPLTLINNGNLMEILNVTAEFEGPHNWSYSANDSNFSIEPLGEHKVDLYITLPELRDGNLTLEAAVIHSITIRAVNITDPFPTWPSSLPANERIGVPAGTKNLDVEILPVFKLKELTAPTQISIVPGHDREVEYEIENDGNAQMDVSIQWDTTDYDPLGQRFDVQADVSSTTLTLGCQDCLSSFPTSIKMGFTFTTLAGDHYNGEEGEFVLTFTPLGIDLPPRIIDTTIRVVRVQTDDVYELSADAAGEFACDNNTDASCRQIEIPWVNLNSLNRASAAQRSYTLGLDGDPSRLASQPDLPERLVNSNIWKDTHWGFSVDDGKCQMLDENGEGISVTPATLSACSSRWDLASTTPYDLEPGGEHGGTILIEVFLPDKQYLAPGDGWNIFLQMRDPAEEPASAAFWTNFVVKLRMSESSDPIISSVSFAGAGIEGDSTTIDVLVRNDGNARMPSGIEVNLDCQSTPYADISMISSNKAVPDLSWNDSFTASWQVTLNPIPWYSSSQDLDCTATLVGTIVQVFGNNLTNDKRDVSLEIDSWATPSVDFVGIPLPSAFAGFLVLLFVTLSLLRRGMEDDQDALHASAYIAAMAFGILSLSGISTVLTILCAMATIAFAGLVAWLSSGELQAIHDDRKKAKIGTRALIEDHDKEQTNTRKELRAIISLAPLAFLPFVLLTPALAIDMEALSLGSMLGFIVFSPILVHLILRFLDSSYDTLYSQLAEIELRAIRIKKILGSAGQRGRGGS